MVLNVREEEDPSRRDRSEETSHPGGSPTPPETSHLRTSAAGAYLSNTLANGIHRRNSTQRDDSGKHETTSDAPLDFSVKRKEDANMDMVEHNGNNRSPLSPGDSEVGSSSSPRYRKPSPVPSSKPIKTETNGTSSVYMNGHSDKIPDPKSVFPGFFPGTGGSAIQQSPGMLLPPYFAPGMVPGMGMMGAMPTLHAEQKATSTNDHQKNGKGSRPFKSYPKEPATMPLGYFGMPNLAALPTVDMNTAHTLSQNSEEMYKYYREYMMKLQQEQRNSKNNQHTMQIEDISDTESLKEHAEERSPSHGGGGVGAAPPSPPCLPSQSSQSPQYHHISTNSQERTKHFPSTPTSSGGSSDAASAEALSRKRSRLPEEQKDACYWERRRKNNEAAKRSRDARRAKEDEIAIRAAFLEQENLKLRVEVAALKTETTKLRCMLYNS